MIDFADDSVVFISASLEAIFLVRIRVLTQRPSDHPPTFRKIRPCQQSLPPAPTQTAACASCINNCVIQHKPRTIWHTLNHLPLVSLTRFLQKPSKGISTRDTIRRLCVVHDYASACSKDALGKGPADKRKIHFHTEPSRRRDRE